MFTLPAHRQELGFKGEAGRAEKPLPREAQGDAAAWSGTRQQNCYNPTATLSWLFTQDSWVLPQTTFFALSPPQSFYLASSGALYLSFPPAY